MAPKATITVNGARFETEADRLLLHVLRDFGIEVPTLCHDERLTPYGGCRLCVVSRRDGRPGLVTSCTTPVIDGMIIDTDTPEVIEARRAQLQLIVLNHRMECPVCTRRGDCRLQDLIYEYGTPEETLPFELVKRAPDLSSPVIVRDPEKCIVCGRCVRLCDEVQGIAAIGLEGRGLDTHVGTFLERPLDCEFCGQCVNACPVAALSARPYESTIPAWLRAATTTTCSLCSCGCQVRVETHEGSVERVSADPLLKPAQGNLCVKGWLGWDLLASEERLTVPLVRRGGKLTPSTWAEAIDLVASKFGEHRGGKAAAIGTPRLTNEDAYLLQRLMRGALHSPHVAIGPTGGLSALVDGVAAVIGAAHSTADLRDLESADVVLVLRGDPTRTHPLVKTELVQAVKKRGQKLVLAHALSGGLERHAARFLHLTPGSEDTLALGLARAIIEREPARFQALESSGAVGVAEWRESLVPYSRERVATACGIDALAFDAVVDLLVAAERPIAIVTCGTGVPGDEATASAAALWLLTLLESGRRKGRILVLGEKFNLQGSLDLGLDPRLLPAYRRVDDATARAELESKWRTPIPAQAGLPATDILERCSRGDLDALYVIGHDPACCWPRGSNARIALESVPFLVVQDAFLTETARIADVVLPVVILGERDGSAVSADGRKRELRRAVRPPAELPQDGAIFTELAKRLGAPLPEGAALDAEVDHHLETARRAVAEAKPVFRAVAPPRESVATGTILLDVAPQLFHSGSVTCRSALLRELCPPIGVRVSARDARAWGVRNGELVRVATANGELHMRVRIDRTVRPGSIVVPWFSGGDGAAQLLEDSSAAHYVDVRKA